MWLGIESTIFFVPASIGLAIQAMLIYHWWNLQHNNGGIKVFFIWMIVNDVIQLLYFAFIDLLLIGLGSMYSYRLRSAH